jgi:predicted SPOUT superfamily RNA methylase MTH1
LKIDDESQFREGVTLPTKTKAGCTLVDCGLRKLVLINKPLKSNVRITVRIPTRSANEQHIIGQVVSPSTPREELGLYWGYRVRLASSLSSVISGSPWAIPATPPAASELSDTCAKADSGGYDLKIGISESAFKSVSEMSNTKRAYKHALVVMGGCGSKGLEYSADCDESIKEAECSDLFDFYVRPTLRLGLGSRVIRSEENVLISLTALQHILS